MPDYTLYDVSIQVVSYLHVATGRTLHQGYDYALHDDRTWRIDLDGFLASRDVETAGQARRLAMQPPDQWLRDEDYDKDSELFSYVSRGQPKGTSEINEQIKDVWGRPYLPGSSLKGALRTAMMWQAYMDSGQRLHVNRLARNGRRAAHRLEQGVFGFDPRHDLLRALQVADSGPPAREGRLRVRTVHVYEWGRRELPCAVEALAPGTKLKTQIKVDDALFSDWAERAELGGTYDWLNRLPQIAQDFTKARLAQTDAWCRWQQREGAPRDWGFRYLRSYLQRLATVSENSCYLQVGWGAGWDSKTLGPAIQRDPMLTDALVDRYGQLGRPNRTPGTHFPETRKMAMGGIRVGEKTHRMLMPLGLVKLTFEEADGA